MSTVGFVGLGDMGSRMVPHLWGPTTASLSST